MSALEIFVRIRQYRNRAGEFHQLAARSFSLEVRERYLTIADHYTALADAELRSDRLARKKRLEQMRAERERSERKKRTVTGGATIDHRADPRSPEPVKLRVTKGAGKGSAQRGGRLQMAAQSDFATTKSAP
jgi:hypothetical protein